MIYPWVPKSFKMDQDVTTDNDLSVKVTVCGRRITRNFLWWMLFVILTLKYRIIHNNKNKNNNNNNNKNNNNNNNIGF